MDFNRNLRIVRTSGSSYPFPYKNNVLWVHHDENNNPVSEIWDHGKWVPVTGIGSGSGDVIIDTKMSDSSSNAIANKTVKKYVDGIASKTDASILSLNEGVAELKLLIDTLNPGYQFMGVATPATNPGTPDQKVFYIANGKGTYTNFGGISITEDEVVILYYDTAWHKLLTGIASQEKLTELDSENGRYKDANTLLNSSGKWSNGDSYLSYFIPILNISEITVFAKSTNACILAFLKDNIHEQGTDANYATGSSRTVLNAGVSVTISVPNDARYLYVSKESNQDDFSPSAVLFDGVNIFLPISNKIAAAIKTCVVGKSGSFDYNSLTEAIIEAPKKGVNKILVNDGIYDIISEFKAIYGDSFFEDMTAGSRNGKGIILKDGIEIKFSAKSKVVCHYNGNNAIVRQRFSPFNSGEGGFTIDGLNIESSNVRYCFHDERESAADAYFNTFRNCAFHQDNSNSDQTFRACIGGGLGSNGHVVIESCRFESVGLTEARGICTYHNTLASEGKSLVIIKDCYFYGYGTIYAHYAGTSTDMSTMIVSGCRFEKSLPLPVSAEGSYTTINIELIEYNNSLVGTEYADKNDVNKISERVDDIQSKNDKISRTSTEDDGAEILLQTDDGKTISSVSANIIDDDTEEHVWMSNDESEKYASIGSYGIKSKAYLDLNGNPIGCNIKYFQNEKVSPLANIPSVVYEADNKSSSNYIVNAVVYPNGEMIVCRRGGVVAKIANDGTETTLMTLAGASDWRGVFMDSNLNVYVSPHSSVDGSMQMTDRGLYRLAYGESQFEKVISLYNPSSSNPNETRQNDDTIWTMCEDADGYLYGGVYCHTKVSTYAPRIYRSIDGGRTWVDYYNFLNVLPNGLHVHCIIYNQYNNALYCIIGEINTVLKSTDHGASWINLNAKCEGDKGTAMLAVSDGVIIGSDGAYELTMSKLLPDDKTIKTCGRVWANTCFGIRRSDVTGWIYAFGKIDSSVNSTSYMPPVEALSSVDALNAWKSTNPTKLQEWITYNNRVKTLYPNDAIRPQHFCILVSKDEGESWEVAYREQCDSTTANGIWTVGYFRNGECLCGRFVNGVVQKPLVISDGKHCYNNGIINELFNKIK